MTDMQERKKKEKKKEENKHLLSELPDTKRVSKSHISFIGRMDLVAMKEALSFGQGQQYDFQFDSGG